MKAWQFIEPPMPTEDTREQEADEIDTEVGIILDDPARLGAACFEADVEMSILDAATLEARKRLGL